MRSVLTPLLFFITLIAPIGCSEPKTASEEKKVTDEITLETLQLTDLNGQSIDLSQLAGKRIFVNFWATWCKPCLAEMPSISAVADSLKNSGVVFLAASDEKMDRVKGFSEKNTYSFQIVSTKADISSLEIFALPATFIFDEKGKLVFRETGARQWDSAESIQLIMEN